MAKNCSVWPMEVDQPQHRLVYLNRNKGLDTSGFLIPEEEPFRNPLKVRLLDSGTF